MFSDGCLHVTQRSSHFCDTPMHLSTSFCCHCPWIYIYSNLELLLLSHKLNNQALPEILSSLSFNASPEWSCSVAEARFQFVPIYWAAPSVNVCCLVISDLPNVHRDELRDATVVDGQRIWASCSCSLLMSLALLMLDPILTFLLKWIATEPPWFTV